MQVASEINKFKAVNSDSSPSAKDVSKTSCQKRKRALSKRGEAAQTVTGRSTQQGENVLLLPEQTSSHQAENLPMS